MAIEGCPKHGPNLSPYRCDACARMLVEYRRKKLEEMGKWR